MSSWESMYSEGEKTLFFMQPGQSRTRLPSKGLVMHLRSIQRSRRTFSEGVSNTLSLIGRSERSADTENGTSEGDEGQLSQYAACLHCGARLLA